jgi:hypothetical protein
MRACLHGTHLADRLQRAGVHAWPNSLQSS